MSSAGGTCSLNLAPSQGHFQKEDAEVTILLDFMPTILSPLCARLWDAKYPAFAWTNGGAIGDVFENGSAIKDELALAGSIVTGAVTKSNGHVVWRKVTTAVDLRPQLKQGDTIRIGTECFTLVSEPSDIGLLLNKPFAGGSGTSKAIKTNSRITAAKRALPLSAVAIPFAVHPLAPALFACAPQSAFRKTPPPPPSITNSTSCRGVMQVDEKN
jgi:hypothetical protein